MCKFMSCIVTKEKILSDLDIDCHKDLVKKFGLDDTKTVDCMFVRVEIRPIDGDIFNHNLKNWKLKIDQDYKPDWFDLESSELKVKKILVKVFKERFVIGKMSEINSGRWFLSGSAEIRDVSGSAKIRSVFGSAKIGSVSGSATLLYVDENIVIKKISDSAVVIYRDLKKIITGWDSEKSNAPANQ